MKSTLLAFAAITTAPFAARASIVLDAHYTPADTSHVAAVTAPPNYSYEDTAQTLTIQNTGTLVQLDLFLERGVGSGTPSGNLHWEIRPTTLAGIPDDAALALLSGNLDASLINADAPNKTWVNITGLALPVTAGQSLAIVLHNNGTNYFGWGAELSSPSPYAGGISYDRQGGVWSFNGGGGTGLYDQAFALHVNAVPEPASLAILALPALLCLRRNRTR